MTIDMTRFYQVFFDEASEHLAEMEGLLLELDVEAPDAEMLNAIFRAAHSIKGGAGTFGFADMAELTHVLETLLDRVRKQETALSTQIVDVSLQAGDLLRAQLEAHQEGREFSDQERLREVCAVLEELAGAPRQEAAPPVSPSAGAERSSQTWTLSFRVGEPGQPREEDLDSLLDALGDLGTVEPLDEGATPKARCWRLTTSAEREAIVNLLAFVCDPEQIDIRADETGASAEEGEGYGFFADAPGAVSATASEADEGFGFFAGAPGAAALSETPEAAPVFEPASEPASEQPQAIVQESAQGYGFFVNAPGADRAVDQDYPGYGLFGGSPGMDQVAALAVESREEQARGYGFFRAAPGVPGGAPESATPRQEAGARPASDALVQPPRASAQPQASTASKRATAGDTSIRVSVEKVDQLINLVGELVITHAMLAQSTSTLDPVLNERVHDGIANLERNSRDLQQAVMSIRMMPISFVFNRFPRVVRDTAAALGKKVNLKLVGEDTELDKGLIERLADPLNHLVRNSIDHGVEMPEQRLAAGKSETGDITLAASHRGGNVVVEVSDDGAGLSRERLLKKAAERGVPIAENAPDKEVWQLIFAPGFSTAERITDISGRGVGMDVVRRNIEAMNGRVEIDSAPGRGTRITIRLPLTLAILDGMSVLVDDEVFILPLTVIRESIRPQPGQCKTLAGKGHVVHVGDDYLPRVVLAELFGLEGATRSPEESILVIVDSNEGRAALQVEELGAQLQVVIKSLETNYRKVEGISGATIMGDGRVAMILDVDALVRLSRREH